MTDYRGITVNERLVISGQMAAFDAAVMARNGARMIAILMATDLTEAQAEQTTAAVLADPAKYGYRP